MSRKWKIAIAVIAAIVLVGYFSLLIAAFVYSFQGALGGKQIAVVRINGIMSSSGSAGGVLTEGGTSAESVVKNLQRADDDSNVRAVILRIDSPGGTASSGQEIYSQLRRMKKPVVASIADVGASAAYWAASGAKEIIAGPASDVGSIGVIISVPNYEGLLKKLGISVVTITRGKYKSIGDPARPMTEEEKTILEGQSEVIYRRFIEDVAAGRRMKIAEVEKLADGLAWPGSQALDKKLVDRLGNWQDAVDRAAELGKIEGEPELVEYGRRSPFEYLTGLFGSKTPGIGDILRSEYVKISR